MGFTQALGNTWEFEEYRLRLGFTQTLGNTRGFGKHMLKLGFTQTLGNASTRFGARVSLGK